MKPVTQITDRAKRYRANKVHKLRKRCEECGSPRNLGVGHRDGDESNNRPSNLFTQCKSCNGKQAVSDKKAGRGVRTRQYNPGAVNLAQYVQAAMDHVRGSHDAGGKVLHETPKSVRQAFAKEIWWRRGYRGNPPADIMPEFWAGKLKDSRGRVVKDKAQAKAILLSELRALGKIPARSNSRRENWMTNARLDIEQRARDAMDRAIDKRLKSRRPLRKSAVGGTRADVVEALIGQGYKKSMAQQMVGQASGADFDSLFRDAIRRNPQTVKTLAEGAADSLYRKFHGRGPDRIYEMQVAGIDPYGGHPELTSLGPLVRLIVGENVELGGQYGDEVKEADWVCELPFVPSVDRWHEWLEERERPIAEAKARLREYKTPDLAAVPNTKQLYILGKQNLTAEQLRAVGADPEKDLLDLGSVFLIEYFTQKRFDRFEPINYFHHFGETTGVVPRLIYDRVHGVLSLAGGEYKVTPRGIEN